MFGTIITGVSIFILGQIFIKIFLDTYINHRKTLGKIYYSLGYYANVYSTTNGDKNVFKEAANELRGLSFELSGTYYLIPFHNILSKAHLLRNQTDIQTSANKLMLISNLIGSSSINDSNLSVKSVDIVNEIKEKLGFPTK